MKRNYPIVALIMLFWFVISFITNIIGPLIPDIIDNFKLSHLAMAGFIPMSFFIAYGIMSIPAGIMIEKIGPKAIFIIGFTMPLIGSLLFAAKPVFGVLLISSFIIGLGMAMLQTVINPMTRAAGGEENFAFFSVMGQLVFGAASFVSPLVYTYMVTTLRGESLHGGFMSLISTLTPPALPWVSLYVLFTIILVVILVIVLFVRFPKVDLADDERSGGRESYAALLKNKYVYLFFIGIFCYVSSEQSIANWMSEFLRVYHGVDPLEGGAQAVGMFWGLMAVGCLVGLGALRLWDSRNVIKVAGFSTLVLLFLSLLASKEIAMVCLPLIGFSISVMFSIVMSLGLNSVDRHHGSFAGILCSGIVGGAVGPLFIGWLGDMIGLRLALMVVAVPMIYIISIGYWARPMITNKTVKLKDMFKR